jgi:hypothetical protein
MTRNITSWQRNCQQEYINIKPCPQNERVPRAGVCAHHQGLQDVEGQDPGEGDECPQLKNR